MSVAKHYQLLAWQLTRIEKMIQLLEQNYEPFLNPSCLKALSEQSGQGSPMIRGIHGIEDIKSILQDATEDVDIMKGGWRPTVDDLAIMIVIITKFLKQCQAFIRFQQYFRHYYYQPDGVGYHRAHNNFAQLSHEAT